MPGQKNTLMPRTRKYSLVAVFAALTVALNLSPLKYPAPYAPFLIYQVWEVPIVAAFLFFGFTASALIALINMLVLLAVFPGALPTGPVYNFIAILSMLLGLRLGMLAIRGRSAKVAMLLIITALGAASRIVIMSLVNWALLRFPPPIGYSLTEEAIRLSLPFIAFFNATLALYTIPLGYIMAEAIRRRVGNILNP